MHALARWYERNHSTRDDDLLADCCLIGGDFDVLLKAALAAPLNRWQRQTPFGQWVGTAIADNRTEQPRRLLSADSFFCEGMKR
jgi:hypothetical protein